MHAQILACLFALIIGLATMMSSAFFMRCSCGSAFFNAPKCTKKGGFCVMQDLFWDEFIEFIQIHVDPIIAQDEEYKKIHRKLLSAPPDSPEYKKISSRLDSCYFRLLCGNSIKCFIGILQHVKII